MKYEKAFNEYEKLPPKEKNHYSCFQDYLGANALCICDGCDEVLEYDEVGEDGLCGECSAEEN